MSRAKTLLVPMIALALVTCGSDTPPTWVDPVLPSTPSGLIAIASGSSAINLSWNASTDNMGVTGYVVRRAGAPVATPNNTSYSDTGLSPATTYSYSVAATDAAGNLSFFSNTVSATTTGGGGGGDTTRPSTPTGLTATATSSSAINLTWNASTDNVGVTGYVVRRNGSQVGTPVATSYTDTGLIAGTTYRYTVAAFDAAGNNSFLSASATATTTGTPPPTVIPPTLGWFQLPNTDLITHCAVNEGFPGVAGQTGCAAIYDAWSGAIFDTARNRLVIWGGGHHDYAGNEVYALSMDTFTMARLNDPSVPLRDGCTNGGTFADGKPVPRHTTNHLAYLPNQDVMFMWGGSQYDCGGFQNDAWFLNLSALSWTKKSNTNGPTAAQFGIGAAYDAANDLVYAHDGFNLFSFNPTTNTWAKRSSSALSSAFSGYTGGMIDPVRKKYFFHGNNGAASPLLLYSYDISSPTASVAPQSTPTTGCSGFIGDYGFGMEYDPIQDKIVGWDGGNTIYLLNPDTFSCTTVSYSGGPASAPNGTFGRFRYVPALNLFVVCNDVNANCYTLRLTP